MDNTFNEDDFTDNRNLQARETETSSEKTPKDIAHSIRKAPAATGGGGTMDFRKFWESRYGRELPEFELQECRDNVSGFFNILAEWDRDNG